MSRAPKPMRSIPTNASLEAAAMRHLARFSTTEAGLVRVLDRAIGRWANGVDLSEQEISELMLEAKRNVRCIAQSFVTLGYIDDRKFAEARVLRLIRGGRSRSVIAAHLAAKGVAAELAGPVLPTPELEFIAAIAFAKRRRFAPFAPASRGESPEKTLSAFARAGHSRQIVAQVAAMTRDEAEAALDRWKRAPTRCLRDDTEND